MIALHAPETATLCSNIHYTHKYMPNSVVQSLALELQLCTIRVVVTYIPSVCLCMCEGHVAIDTTAADGVLIVQERNS